MRRALSAQRTSFFAAPSRVSAALEACAPLAEYAKGTAAGVAAAAAAANAGCCQFSYPSPYSGWKGDGGAGEDGAGRRRSMAASILAMCWAHARGVRHCETL
jgi:hypothetical protein